MEIKLEFDNKALLAFKVAPDNAKEAVRRSIRESAVLVQERAQKRHRFISRTGNLERAVVASIQEAQAAIFLDKRTAFYAGFVHEGTAPHDIFPKKRKCLRWAGRSGFVFAKKVHHPGTKPDQFLYKALNDSRTEIQAIFNRHIAGVFTGGA
jgi:hypothetical protein